MAVSHCYLAAAKCPDPPDCANCFEMGYITYHYGDLGRDCRLFLSSLLGASRSRHPINSKPLNVAQRASANSSQVRRSDNIYPDFIVADGTCSFPKKIKILAVILTRAMSRSPDEGRANFFLPRNAFWRGLCLLCLYSLNGQTLHEKG